MSQRYEGGDGGQRVSEEYPPGSRGSGGDAEREVGQDRAEREVGQDRTEREVGQNRAEREVGQNRAEREVRQNPPVMETQGTRPVSEVGDERSTEAGREGRQLTGTRRREPVVAETRAGVRSRYGGFDVVASFLGFAVAIFFLLLLLGIVGAIVGSVASQIGATGLNADGSVPGNTQNLGVGAVIGSAVALLLAYFIGGYAAGRLARYDGVANGVGVVAWTVLVAVILGVLGAVLGSKFNVASQLHLNVSPGSLKTGGAIALVVTLALMVLGSTLGGALGAGYHRRVDRAAGIEA